MKLQGRVYGYESTIAEFTVKDVTEGHVIIEDGEEILYVRSDLGETPIIYDSIRSQDIGELRKKICELIELIRIPADHQNLTNIQKKVTELND